MLPEFPKWMQERWDKAIQDFSDAYDSAEALEDLREFASLRTRREMQWERLFAWDWDFYRFDFYDETKRETLAHFAELRRTQKRDGLCRRFPGAGSGFDKALAELSKAQKEWVPL